MSACAEPSEAHNPAIPDDADDTGNEGSASAVGPDDSVWVPCRACNTYTQIEAGERDAECAREECTERVVRLTENVIAEEWVACDKCDKWRRIDANKLPKEGMEWTCAHMFPGATCDSPENLWVDVQDLPQAPQPQPAARAWVFGRGAGRGGGRGGRGGGAGRKSLNMDLGQRGPRTQRTVRPRKKVLLEAEVVEIPDHFAERCMAAGPGLPPEEKELQLDMKFHQHLMPEFVPGRDVDVRPEQMAAGYTLRCEGELVLSTGALTYEDIKLFEPFTLACLRQYSSGILEPGRDGRYSAGPLDLHTFLNTEENAASIMRALKKRQEWLQEKGLPAGTRSANLPYLVHVHPDGRRAFIGEERDTTGQGNLIMSHNKSFKSLPIRSWTGGVKVSDMPGGPRRLTQGKLCTLDIPSHCKRAFDKGAEAVWRVMLANPACRPIAERMLQHMKEQPWQAVSRIGNTGFNAYSVNLDYRTGTHTDGKNVQQSLSALVILETGTAFAGGLYMLPQFKVAIAPRQGTVLFHRSGDSDIGLHGNSEIYRPDPTSHRIAVVLYQTQLQNARQVESSLAWKLRIPREVLTPCENKPKGRAAQAAAGGAHATGAENAPPAGSHANASPSLSATPSTSLPASQQRAAPLFQQPPPQPSACSQDQARPADTAAGRAEQGSQATAPEGRNLCGGVRSPSQASQQQFLQQQPVWQHAFFPSSPGAAQGGANSNGTQQATARATPHTAPATLPAVLGLSTDPQPQPTQRPAGCVANLASAGTFQRSGARVSGPGAVAEGVKRHRDLNDGQACILHMHERLPPLSIPAAWGAAHGGVHGRAQGGGQVAVGGLTHASMLENLLGLQAVMSHNSSGTLGQRALHRRNSQSQSVQEHASVDSADTLARPTPPPGGDALASPHHPSRSLRAPTSSPPLFTAYQSAAPCAPQHMAASSRTGWQPAANHNAQHAKHVQHPHPASSMLARWSSGGSADVLDTLKNHRRPPAQPPAPPAAVRSPETPPPRERHAWWLVQSPASTQTQAAVAAAATSQVGVATPTPASLPRFATQRRDVHDVDANRDVARYSSRPSALAAHEELYAHLQRKPPRQSSWPAAERSEAVQSAAWQGARTSAQRPRAAEGQGNHSASGCRLPAESPQPSQHACTPAASLFEQLMGAHQGRSASSQRNVRDVSSFTAPYPAAETAQARPQALWRSGSVQETATQLQGGSGHAFTAAADCTRSPTVHAYMHSQLAAMELPSSGHSTALPPLPQPPGTVSQPPVNATGTRSLASQAQQQQQQQQQATLHAVASSKRQALWNPQAHFHDWQAPAPAVRPPQPQNHAATQRAPPSNVDPLRGYAREVVPGTGAAAALPSRQSEATAVPAAVSHVSKHSTGHVSSKLACMTEAPTAQVMQPEGAARAAQHACASPRPQVTAADLRKPLPAAPAAAEAQQPQAQKPAPETVSVHTQHLMAKSGSEAEQGDAGTLPKHVLGALTELAGGDAGMAVNAFNRAVAAATTNAATPGAGGVATGTQGSVAGTPDEHNCMHACDDEESAPWPWAPGTILNIDTDKWASLRGATPAAAVATPAHAAATEAAKHAANDDAKSPAPESAAAERAHAATPAPAVPPAAPAAATPVCPAPPQPTGQTVAQRSPHSGTHSISQSMQQLMAFALQHAQ